MAKEAKQVIVMRNDLGMRKGKMIAQGAHSSIAWMTHRMMIAKEVDTVGHYRGYHPAELGLNEAEYAWVEGRFTKICVRVDSEEELLEIHLRALDAGLTSHLITDAGLTEFAGVPTRTCCAIGPNWSDDIDNITGHLKLL